MPYPMSHFYIAENILAGKGLAVNNAPQFYLGTLGPDAVHFRKDYSRAQKRVSHIYDNLDRGNLEVFAGNWIKNVENFYTGNKSNIDRDFLLGYCIHLMADIYNYIYIWTPFKLAYGRENDKLYQADGLSTDLEIYQKENYESKLFPILEKSEPFDFINLISKNEMAELKNNILNVQYRDKQEVNTKTNKFMIYEKLMEWNNKALQFIIDEFSGLKEFTHD